MLALVDNMEEVKRLAPALKRAGYQVFVAHTVSDAARWLNDAGGSRRAVVGVRDALAPELSRSLAEARASPGATDSRRKSIAPGIQYDAGRRTIVAGTRICPLTAIESRLLQVFLEHPNRPLSRAQLLDLVWGYDYRGHDREVDVYIRYLRRKMEPEPAHPRFIVTVRGLGYMLELDHSE